MSQTRKKRGQLAWGTIRDLALLACGGTLFDHHAGWPTIEGPQGEIWWRGNTFGQLWASTYLEHGQSIVHGFSITTPYTLSEEGRHALQTANPSWQEVLRRPLFLRTGPGGKELREITLGEVTCLWMQSYQGDCNVYLHVRYQWGEGTCRSVALKKDNASLYREGLLPATQDLGRGEIPNPYLFLSHCSGSPSSEAESKAK